MIRLIEDFNAGSVASTSADGTPVVSPKGTFVVVDDGCIAFGNIRSPATVENLRARPDVDVNFIDVHTHAPDWSHCIGERGLRMRGWCRREANAAATTCSTSSGSIPMSARSSGLSRRNSRTVWRRSSASRSARRARTMARSIRVSAALPCRLNRARRSLALAAPWSSPRCPRGPTTGSAVVSSVARRPASNVLDEAAFMIVFLSSKIFERERSLVRLRPNLGPSMAMINA